MASPPMLSQYVADRRLPQVDADHGGPVTATAIVQWYKDEAEKMRSISDDIRYHTGESGPHDTLLARPIVTLAPEMAGRCGACSTALTSERRARAVRQGQVRGRVVGGYSIFAGCETLQNDPPWPNQGLEDPTYEQEFASEATASILWQRTSP